MTNELYHYGVLGMKWRIRRNQKKLQKAEKYLGRKLHSNDGFAKDGSDITRARLKKVKQYDEQEKQYKSVKKKTDPSYAYVRGYDLRYHNALSAKDVSKIIKKLEKNPSTNVMHELEKSHRTKQGKQMAARALMSFGATSMLMLATAYNNQNKY